MTLRPILWIACFLAAALTAHAQTKEKCAACQGGTVECASCQGKAKDPLPCLACAGAGSMSCPVCDGRGRWEKTDRFPPGDVHGETHDCKTTCAKTGPDCKFCDKGKVRCPACKATGKAARTCLACAQTGRLRCPKCAGYAAAPACPACKGTGQGKCGACAGKGETPAPCASCRGLGERPCDGCFALGHSPCPGCRGSGHSGGTCEVCHGRGLKSHKDCGGKGRLPCANCEGKGVRSTPCWLCDQRKSYVCVHCVKSQVWFAVVPDSQVRLWILPLSAFEPELPALIRRESVESRQGWRLIVDARFAAAGEPGTAPTGLTVVRIDGDSLETPLGDLAPADSDADPQAFQGAVARIEAALGGCHSPSPSAPGPGRIATRVLWGTEPPVGAAWRLQARIGSPEVRIDLEARPATGDDWVRLLLGIQ